MANYTTKTSACRVSSLMVGENSGPLVGKKELALALRWSRPLLDKRLKTDPNFPVVSIGDQGGGWQFDLAAVQAYLAGAAASQPQPQERTAPAIDPAQLRDAVAPPLPAARARPKRSAHHAGEATARQRKDDAEATLRELKVAEQTAQTMLRSEVQRLASEICIGLASDLDAMPEEMARKLGMPDDAASGIRKMIDDVRVAMVARFRPLLADQGAGNG